MGAYDDNTGGMFAKLENNKGFDKIYNDHLINPYFNWVNHTNEQNLTDMLVAEAVINRGVECVYIRREMTNVDLIFGEDPLSKFTKNFRMALYVESFEGWDGDGDWFSKFGFQVNDEMNVCINPKLFNQQGDGKQPLMGDLIYFPMANSLFEISWVEKEDPWYMNGALPMRKMKMVKFVYSGEEIQLERPESVIDSISDLMSFGNEETDEMIDIGKINALDGRWDDGITQGEEMDQLEEEVEQFYQSEQVVPRPSDVQPVDPRSRPVGFKANNNPFNGF
ncbi:neck protein [Vibrio phage 1.081.O._10N.286.52.C2]|nr:neck protein [Vibrio phage 1.081.O._10N.286.52.C2]